MIFDDDLDPKTRKKTVKPLDNLSVPELKAYLAELAAETARVTAEIDKKENYKSTADNFFRKDGD